MAVRHLKALRYANGGTHKSQLRPTFLTDEELKHLILEAEDGFLFIVSCENTRILYVSDSVNHVLQHSKVRILSMIFKLYFLSCSFNYEFVFYQLKTSLVYFCDKQFPN